jgi:hypothetical protein
VTEHTPDLSAAIEHLGLRSGEGLSTLELLRGYREQVEADAAALENPRAVFEYLDFFNDLVTRTINECERIAAGLRQGVSQPDLDALRQLASNAAAEQRRCLMFRDKCINRPLPHERMRPLLNEISVTTRDQLTAFRDLTGIAAKLEEQMQQAAPPPQDEDKRSFDRRALFTKLFNKNREG